MSSEVKIKVEPGSVPTDVAGSVSVSENIKRSADFERRGELKIKDEDDKVGVKREAEEKEVKRTLSFGSDELKTVDKFPPKSKALVKKEARMQAKKAREARSVEVKSTRSRNPDVKNGEAAQGKKQARSKMASKTPSDESSVSDVSSLGLGLESLEVTSSRSGSAVTSEPGPYEPNLASPFATTHSTVIIWHAGRILHEIQHNALLIPLDIPPPDVIWGPVPRPAFEDIDDEDRDLAMQFLAHTLLCAGFRIKQSDLPLADDGDYPYYQDFSFYEITKVGKSLYHALASLVGSVVSNYTPQTPSAAPTPDRSDPRVDALVRQYGPRDPYVTPVRGPLDADGDAIMESVRRSAMKSVKNDARFQSSVPAPVAADPSAEERSKADPSVTFAKSAQFQGASRSLITVKPSSKSSKADTDADSSDSDDPRTRTRSRQSERYDMDSDQEKRRKDKQRSKSKASKAKKSKRSSRSSTDSEQEGDVYMGYDSDSDRAPRIRLASTIDPKNFSGKEGDDEKARAWLDRLSRKGRRDGLSPREMADLFSDYVVGGAKNWHDQLPKATRRKWPELVKAFRFRYCNTRTRPMEKYYSMERRTDEPVLDYFYRLNVAAKKAKIDISSSLEGHEAHIDRFYASVLDEELVRILSLAEIDDVAELEAALKSQARSIRRYEVARERESKFKNKDYAKAKDSTKEFSRTKSNDYGRVKSSDPPRVKNVHWNTSANPRADPEGDEDSELNGPSDPSPDDDSAEEDERYDARQVAVVHEGADPRTRSYEGRERAPCATCGSKLHNESACWKNLVCQRCNRMGHPSERCREVCKACDKVHEKGECHLEELYNKLSAWYNPTRHAGILPPDIEKALN